MSFVLPGCRSNFSLLWGTAFPEQLAARAAEMGLEHLGLADSDNLYGAIDFYHACRDRGINPLIGVRLTTTLGTLHLVAQNHAGYQNLCRLVTQRKLHEAVEPADLDQYGNDLICLAPAESDLGSLRELYGDNLSVAIHGNENWSVREIAKKYSLNLAADASISFLNRADYRLHLLLRAIDSGALAANLDGVAHDTADAYFPNQTEFARRFANFPDAVAEGIRIARSCHLEFPRNDHLLPAYPDYDGDKQEHLRQKALDGLSVKQGKLTAAYLARLDFELSVIARTGYTDYFLIVAGIVEHCLRSGIPVVGRGSAAGSLVAYSLRITEVDPIREGLYFERFLNEARSDPPDIDLDIDWRRRDDVLAYIYDRFGHERTAMIASYIRFGARMAVREVAKTAGVPTGDIDRLAKRLPHVGPGEISAALQGLPPAVRGGLDLRRFATILEDAARLDNFPRHLGIHPGGIVITPTPLTDYVALERATKGLVVTQCDMYQGEKLGLVKIDILGQRGLAVIVDSRAHAKEMKGDDFSIPDGDPATYRLLQSGKTIGVFQIESPGLRSLLRDLKPNELNDITLALALIRPGASDSGMKKNFLDRHHGRETTTYPDPRLEDILGETHGVFIYQEQVLLCARAVAGFNLPAADRLRRAMTKARLDGLYEKLLKQFIGGAERNGVPTKNAIEVFKLLTYFAGFGFCKAHAATYGYLAYQSAYFKTHFPAQFMMAVINNGGGYYPTAVYVSEARRLGTGILLPDINRSEEHFSLDGNALRIGLSRIKGLELDTIEQILSGRPFESLDDFLSRVRLSAAELESLIKVGAFDSLEPSRARLLWRLRLACHKRVPVGVGATDSRDESPADIFSGQLIIPKGKRLPALPDFSPFERFGIEQETLGFSAGCHPLTLFPAYAGPSIAEILSGGRNGAPTTLTGWLTDIKRIKTREKKQPMVFLTFEDLHDTFEVVLFPEKYKEYSEMIRHHRLFRIEGELNLEDGNVAIIADRLFPAPTGLAEKAYI
jgi:DNA-directed DNA polymerase III PolC